MIYWLPVFGLVFATVGGPVASGAESWRVRVDGLNGVLDVSGNPPMVRARVRVQSQLPVTVDQVEIGILFAAGTERLAGADPGTLYRSGSRTADGIGVIRQKQRIDLPPSGTAPVLIEHALETYEPEPEAFAVHLLGYRLADGNAEMLLSLLRTDLPADERAAVETLSLLGAPTEKAVARQKWAPRAEWIEPLAGLLAAPVPESVTVQDVLERVFAIRALGVLGGAAAREALAGLRADPRRQAPLDEVFPVLVIARLRTGSELETPVAFTVPADAHCLADVIAAAEADLDVRQLSAFSVRGAQAPTPPPTSVSKSTGGRATAGGDNHGKEDDPLKEWAWGWLGGLGIFGLVLVAGWRGAVRRRDR